VPRRSGRPRLRSHIGRTRFRGCPRRVDGRLRWASWNARESIGRRHVRAVLDVEPYLIEHRSLDLRDVLDHVFEEMADLIHNFEHVPAGRARGSRVQRQRL